MFPVLIGVSILIFFLQVITPGNPADLALGENASANDKAKWSARFGLDKPIFVQYGKFIFNIITKGDFGTSYRTGKSITGQLLQRWPITFVLALLTTVVASILGLILGIISALNRGKWFDGFSRILGMLGISMPNFWFALLLIMLFAIKLKWVPVSGFYGPKYWILPSLTLGILGSAAVLRITRSAMLDNIHQDFVRTARAKGQIERVVIYRHILKNAMIPIITNIGFQFAMGLAGTMVLEQIFSIAGLGSLMIFAINNRDYPQVRGSILLVAFSICTINLIVDILYAFFDPRVRARYKNSN
jgi:peptide/nickel transport system permease protein